MGLNPGHRSLELDRANICPFFYGVYMGIHFSKASPLCPAMEHVVLGPGRLCFTSFYSVDGVNHRLSSSPVEYFRPSHYVWHGWLSGYVVNRNWIEQDDHQRLSEHMPQILMVFHDCPTHFL